MRKPGLAHCSFMQIWKPSNTRFSQACFGLDGAAGAGACSVGAATGVSLAADFGAVGLATGLSAAAGLGVAGLVTGLLAVDDDAVAGQSIS